MFVGDFVDEYGRYRAIGDKAMAQVSDDNLNRVIAPDGNSIAMLVRHLSGNLRSRFTNFLTEDGEKRWRDRDGEFADGSYTRVQVDEIWRDGWSAVEQALDGMTDDDLQRTVTIRGIPITVHAALVRSATHAAMHVGQIVLIARVVTAGDWKWISIPKGQSQQYNQAPTLEKRPAP